MVGGGRNCVDRELVVPSAGTARVLLPLLRPGAGSSLSGPCLPCALKRLLKQGSLCEGSTTHGKDIPRVQLVTGPL